jgi:peptide/nickel transport system permease protein
VFRRLVAGFFGGKVTPCHADLDWATTLPREVARGGDRGAGSMLNVFCRSRRVIVHLARGLRSKPYREERVFVDQARVSGARPRQILFHHILPNTLSPVIVYGSTLVGIMIVLGAGLSFLGLGITPPRPDWGIMCSDGRNFLSVAPHVSAVPGIMLILVAMSFNIVGDGLRDALDPKLRR